MTYKPFIYGILYGLSYGVLIFFIVTMLSPIAFGLLMIWLLIDIFFVQGWRRYDDSKPD